MAAQAGQFGGVFAVASLVEAHAPLATERDTPANPSAGRTLLRRLFFEERFDMAQSPVCLGHIEPIDRKNTATSR
jgi:hypothetical protein